MGDRAKSRAATAAIQARRATLRVGDVFLKIDAVQTRADVEVEAMAMAPVPTAQPKKHNAPGARNAAQGANDGCLVAFDHDRNR